MNARKGYYSIIQYCPDLGRLEAANVGVLLFRPEPHFIKARTAVNNRRIKHFFGSEGRDWKRVNSFKMGICERIELVGSEITSLSDLERFIASQANVLQITPPRPMRVVDPDHDLEELFRELVGESTSKESKRSLQSVLEQE